MISRSLLIVFARFPLPGKTKTRLIPTLGEHGAARLHRDMARHTIGAAGRLLPEVRVELWCDGGTKEEIGESFGSDMPVRHQSGGNLGQRMLDAFSHSFSRGFERVVLAGTDCPFLTPEILKQAFHELASADCVLGPAHDGGYYLIGLSRPCPEVFEGISWGGSEVLDQTRARARAAGVSVSMLEVLHDIDRPEDLPLWKEAFIGRNDSISVIIPALNEGVVIEDAVRRLSRIPGIEVIVADGGSGDGTPELARAGWASVVHAPPGRAAQMNAGAKHAGSGILLFLHADTRLPDDFDRWARAALADPSVIAGAFGLGFDDRSLSLRVTAWGANLRSRLLQLPYGDQAFFIKRADFREAGGFPLIPIMEDAVFAWTLKNRGRVVTLPVDVVTSSRRYRRLGVFRTFLANQFVIVCFLLGADPAAVAGLYRTGGSIGEWLVLSGSTVWKKILR